MVHLSKIDEFGNADHFDLQNYLQQFSARYKNAEFALIQQACQLNQIVGTHTATQNGTSCFLHGLAMAELLVELGWDADTVAAGTLYSCVEYGVIPLEDVAEQINPKIADLIKSTQRLSELALLPSAQLNDPSQLENLRKMLLSIVSDIRTVIIKLVDRCCLMRKISHFDEASQMQLAKQTMQIYAPLANRLGVTRLKWELEDASFRYSNPSEYKIVAQQLKERRVDREKYVQNIVSHLQQAFTENGFKNFQIQGRVKHIYSIYRKMKRKNLSFDKIYDIVAVRVLVDNIENCYEALAITHQIWPMIAEEFDDYIAKPKANGYRSLHTAVHGPDNKNIEVQIRTHEMHRDSELGVAAHWVYKEGESRTHEQYQNKIAWLRNLFAWQKELSDQAGISEQVSDLLNDRVYVFTPKGDIIDLIQGATALDFAYYLHSEIGHRCRGAKINGQIAPLTQTLKTGDRVEVITARKAGPSRDWINPHLGYLQSPRARAKVIHWFKQQDYDKNRSDGMMMLERECKRLHLPSAKPEDLAKHFGFKTADDMFAQLGAGTLRIQQILPILEQEQKKLATQTATLTQESPPAHPGAATLITPPHESRSGATATNNDIYLEGVGRLLSFTAKCCNPVPGDAIIGYITLNRGIAVHQKTCPNVLRIDEKRRGKLIEIQWRKQLQQKYPVNLQIHAFDRAGLLKDLTQILTSDHINVRHIHTKLDSSTNHAWIYLVVDIVDINELSTIMDRIARVPNVLQVKRESNS